jgi:23S rRNA (guanosine2251-2'-O)-methyltransferase
MSTDDDKRQQRPFKRTPGRHGKSRHGGTWQKSRAPDRPPRWAEGDATPDGVVLIYGVHPVEAALANPARVIGKLYMTENAENRMRASLERRGVSAERVSPRDLDRRLGAETVHQGVLLETEPLVEPRMIELAKSAGGRPLIVLDQVTDPHNVGAILRSAAVFGAAGLIMTQRHSPPLNGTLAKSASGALELVPVARVQNLARSLVELKEAGCTLIGLDEGGEVLDEAPWPQQPVFVLGAEGKGLRELTRETCDRVCRIATESQLASLNVSNAAAVALHLAHMRRRKRQ